MQASGVDHRRVVEAARGYQVIRPLSLAAAKVAVPDSRLLGPCKHVEPQL